MKKKFKFIEPRCQWCGSNGKELTDVKPSFRPEKPPLSFSLYRGATKCPNCGLWSILKRQSFWWLLYMASFLIGFILIILMENSFYIVVISTSFLSTISYEKMPREKHLDGKYYEAIPEDLTKYRAKIIWLGYQNGGLAFVKYRVCNDYIFPICFLDRENNIKSNMWCVKISKIKRHKEEIEADINFLLEQAPEYLMKEGSEFIIFNRKVKIGEGIILKQEGEGHKNHGQQV